MVYVGANSNVFICFLFQTRNLFEKFGTRQTMVVKIISIIIVRANVFEYLLWERYLSVLKCLKNYFQYRSKMA